MNVQVLLYTKLVKNKGNAGHVTKKSHGLIINLNTSLASGLVWLLTKELKNINDMSFTL